MELTLIDIIGAVLALVGCILIFDSRRIVKKSFSFGDENVTTLGIKIFGTIIALIGGLLAVL